MDELEAASISGSAMGRICGAGGRAPVSPLGGARRLASEPESVSPLGSGWCRLCREPLEPLVPAFHGEYILTEVLPRRCEEKRVETIKTNEEGR